MIDLLLNYRACGAESRDDYLRGVANENGLPLECVRKITESVLTCALVDFPTCMVG